MTIFKYELTTSGDTINLGNFLIYLSRVPYKPHQYIFNMIKLFGVVEFVDPITIQQKTYFDTLTPAEDALLNELKALYNHNEI